MVESNSSRRILVLLATGKQGDGVVRSLAQRNTEIRMPYEILAVTRDKSSAKARSLAKLPGVYLLEITTNKAAHVFEKAASVGSGGPIYGVFCVLLSFDNPQGISGEIRQGKDMIDESNKHGVRHFIYSSGDCAFGTEQGVSHFDSKREIEEHLTAAQKHLPFTILRPSILMEILQINDSFKARLVNAAILGSLKTNVPVLAAKDVGEFAALAFDQPEKFVGQTLALAGDYLNGEDIRHVYDDVFGKSIPAFSDYFGRLLIHLRPEMKKSLQILREQGPTPDLSRLRIIHPSLMDLHGYFMSL